MYPRDVVKISVLLALRLAANIFKERRPQVSAALTTKCGAEAKIELQLQRGSYMEFPANWYKRK